jgi:hypothetical protein
MRILGYILVVLFVTTSAIGQQINPVPDYIFRNQMSVGRNAPTDTAAYLSVGPRYGANKGLMPPMVVDTNAVTGTKRNGLLIFSVQLNNFAYWDSTTSRFRKITADAVVDSLVFSTRAWRQKGDDSLGAVISVKTDTALLSTRAYRQKAVDSLVTLISTLGGGTVLSVGSGYGTNFSTITTSGSVVVDSLVITSRASRDKLKDSLNANIALKVNISDTSTMLGAYLRKADTTSMLSPYLRKGDTTAMLSPYVRSAGYGLLKGTQTLSVDSALMATRARVQKGIDSVASLVTTTDSVVFSTRAWRQKGVDSVAALANTKATATGTTNYLSKFTGTSSLGNSIVYATTSEVGISTPSPTEALDVNGKVRIRTIDSSASPSNMLWTDATGVIRKTAVPSVGVDTLAISTRAWRQKGIDSVNANVALKVNISDTATMLSPYVRIAGFGLTKGTQTLSVDSVTMATRARVQKGIDSVAGLSRVTGSGSAAYIPKFSAAQTLANSNIVDNGQTVQIGSTTGSGAFYIRNDTAVTTTLAALGTYGAKIDFLNIGVDNFRIAMPASTGDLAFYSSATNERMRLTSTGELLIGTATDAGDYRLQVAGSIYNTTGAVLAASSGNVGIGTTSPNFKLEVSTTNPAMFLNTTSGQSTIYFSNTNNAIYNSSTDNGLVFYVKTQNRVKIDTLGNVGIGTTNPSGNANRILNIYGAESNELHLTNATTGTGNTDGFTLLQSGNDVYAYNYEAGFFEFGTSNLARMRITSAGDVGIGTTSPSERLHVNGRARIATIDSSASPINMLWADVNGVVRKTAVPASVVGSGNTNYIPKWTNATALGNSVMYEQGGEITVGSTTDFGAFTLQVDGTQYVKTSLAVGTTTLLADADVQIGATSGNDGNLQIAASSTGIAQLSFGSGTGNDRFRGFVAYYHQGDSLIMGTASTQRLTLNATGLGLGTAPAERLDVNGRARVRTIDSSGSPINMLWADNNGVVRKAAVPSGGGGTVTSVATGFGIDGGTITSTGTLTADTVEMATRARVQKGIDSVAGLARVTGSGTANYFPYWTGTTALGNSEMYQLNSEVLIGYTADQGTHKLQVNGNTFTNGSIKTAAPSGGTAAEWKLGTRVASSVTLDGTQYIEVDIGGTLYYLATVSFLEPKPKPNP